LAPICQLVTTANGGLRYTITPAGRALLAKVTATATK
jgi:hypothetical protein